jgi:hypothetical protein
MRHIIMLKVETVKSEIAGDPYELSDVRSSTGHSGLPAVTMLRDADVMSYDTSTTRTSQLFHLLR